MQADGKVIVLGDFTDAGGVTGPDKIMRLNADGTVRNITITKPSGHAVLDDAARRIVELAAPFPPFPPEIRAEVDVLRERAARGAEVLVRALELLIDRRERGREEAEEPELVRLKTRFPVISMTLYGDVARGYLYDLADDVKRRMLALPRFAIKVLAERP